MTANQKILLTAFRALDTEGQANLWWHAGQGSPILVGKKAAFAFQDDDGRN